ncbi:hypothetical protein, partial [Klebsiella pneumoniae]|uniref:hypothetical protein n=1 Tax=Klebsiella pneumoniae TaxID=573 RepID=UPI00255578C6
QQAAIVAVDGVPAGINVILFAGLLLRDGRLRGVLLMGDCTAAAALTARLESDEPATVDWLFDPSSTQPQAAGIMTMTKPVLVLLGHGMVCFLYTSPSPRDR